MSPRHYGEDGLLTKNYDMRTKAPTHHKWTVVGAPCWTILLTGVRADDCQSRGSLSHEEDENHHGDMILLDGCLYGANGGYEGGFLVCLDFKTGKVLWDERDDPERRAPKGSVALADGRLYYRTEKGTLLLIEPNPKQYLEHGRFDQPERSQQPAWAHPVVANGRLYVRDQDVLFCYDVKAK